MTDDTFAPEGFFEDDPFDNVTQYMSAKDHRRFTLSSKPAHNARANKCLPTDTRFATRIDATINNGMPCPPYLTPAYFPPRPRGDGCCFTTSQEDFAFLDTLSHTIGRVKNPEVLHALGEDLGRWFNISSYAGLPVTDNDTQSCYTLRINPSVAWYEIFMKFLFLAEPKFRILEADPQNLNQFHDLNRGGFWGVHTGCKFTWAVEEGRDDHIIRLMKTTGVVGGLLYFVLGANSLHQIEPFSVEKVEYLDVPAVDVNHLADSIAANNHGFNNRLYIKLMGFFGDPTIGVYADARGFGDTCLDLFQALGDTNISGECSVSMGFGPANPPVFDRKTVFPNPNVHPWLVFTNMIEAVTTGLRGGAWVSTQVQIPRPTWMTNPNDRFENFDITPGAGNNTQHKFRCTITDIRIEFKKIPIPI